MTVDKFTIQLQCCIWVWIIMVNVLESCMGYTISNSSCGVGYPYTRCYEDYKVLRIFSPDENAIKYIDENIVNGFDVDVWSYPSTIENSIDTQNGFDVMVSPNDIDKVLDVVDWYKLNKTVLHHDVVDMLKREANMASTNILFNCTLICYYF